MEAVQKTGRKGRSEATQCGKRKSSKPSEGQIDFQGVASFLKDSVGVEDGCAVHTLVLTGSASLVLLLLKERRGLLLHGCVFRVAV